MAGDRLLDHADLLAHHMSQALELAKAAGADPNPELERRAGRFLALAGERAMELDITAAHGLFGRALELVPAGTEEHGLLLTRAADASTALARFEAARALYDEAALELEAAGSRANAVRAYGMLGVAYFQIGGADGMRAALEHALELLEGLPPGPEHVDIYGRMVALEMLSGQPPQVGLVWAEKAIALGEPLGLRRELIRPYQWRGLTRCELGDLGGLEDLEHALSEALALPMPSMVVPSHVNLGDHLWRQRGPAAGLEILAAGIASRSSKVGGRPTWPQAESCWMLHDLGEWDELLRVAEEIRQVEAEHGPAQPGAISQTYAALVLIRRGAVDEAARLAADVLARARAMEEPQVLAPSLVVSALVEEAQGNSGAAVTHVDEYRLVTRSRPYFRAQNLTDAVRVACAGGDLALAESLLDNLVTAAEWDRLAALTARATIAAAQVELEAAKAAFSEAAEGWKAFGCVFEHALALRGAGEEDAATAILDELGVPQPPAQTAARTAK